MKRIRLAVVDDHTLVRDGLVRIFEAIPEFDVVGAEADCRGAVALAGSARPDVLLLDLALPDGNGLALIGTLKDRWPSLRILAVSMHSEPEYACEAVRRGAAGLVSKSDPVECLVDAIRRVAAGETLAVGTALSSREREILDLISAGHTNEQAGRALGIQPKTVAGHCQRIMDKLGIHTRAGLVAYGRRTRGV